MRCPVVASAFKYIGTRLRTEVRRRVLEIAPHVSRLQKLSRRRMTGCSCWQC